MVGAMDKKGAFHQAEYYYRTTEYEKAFEWYQKDIKSETPNPVSFFNIGYAYEHGEGVACDPEQAFFYYKKAAGLGLPQAMYNLAFFYQNGICVSKSQTMADEYSRKATAALNKMADDLFQERQKVELLECERASYASFMSGFERLERGNTELGKSLEACYGEAKMICEQVVRDHDWLKQKNHQLQGKTEELQREKENALSKIADISEMCRQLRQETEKQKEALEAAETIIKEEEKKLSEAKTGLLKEKELTKAQEEEISVWKQKKPFLKKKTVLLAGELFATLLLGSYLGVNQKAEALGYLGLGMMLYGVICGMAGCISVAKNSRKLFCIFDVFTTLLIPVYFYMTIADNLREDVFTLCSKWTFLGVLFVFFVLLLVAAFRKDTFCDLE